ncbi:hypothetical protein AGLY_003414 [Aphis glycines]|uniref:Helitron helicase-like domain-containing protein n=1 Tax=Aphis glycines TaxID=307491 RepID=A0A6G0TZZ0_APHGL|nr:hypothetical protein AGLY_003414 [Aphis glycines]
MYNRRQQNNTPERSQTLVQEQPLQIVRMTILCPKCHAKKWKDETRGLCCADGKVVLHQFENLPDLIKSLIDNSHPLSKHFFDNSRRYNILFQMTSFGVSEIAEGNFMPSLKIQGQSFRSNLELRSFDELQNFKLIIHADRVPQDEHRGQYNAPTIDEVVVLLVKEDKGPRNIVLHGRSGHLNQVSELNRSFDALQYPLIQFAVDMVAKMISERLHFIRNHQKQLRANDYVHLRDAVNNDANINANNVGQQIPNKDRDPILYEIVCKNMITWPMRRVKY